jgi:hypothetical protein
VAKQMKVIHLGGFDEEERRSYIPIIYTNIIYNMKALVNGAIDMKITLENEVKCTAISVSSEGQIVSLSARICLTDKLIDG